jgi:hypothetical protein
MDEFLKTREKKEFIRTYLSKHFKIKESCKVMNMSPSSLYYKRVDWKKKDQLVLNKIKKFLEIVPVAGVPSVTSHLKKEMRINKKRVARIMKLNGLIGRKKPIKKRSLEKNELEYKESFE